MPNGFWHFPVALKMSLPHKLENRCVLRHISNMRIHSWAVLGGLGCREREKNPNCHEYATFQGSFFMFSGAKIKSFEKCYSVSNKKLHTLKK